MLQKGDLVPHFTVRTLAGEPVRYSSIWQSRNLVLIALSESESEAGRRYMAEVTARTQEFERLDAACVVTRDPIAGMPAPGALVRLAREWDRLAEAGCSIHVAAREARVVADLERLDSGSWELHPSTTYALRALLSAPVN